MGSKIHLSALVSHSLYITNQITSDIQFSNSTPLQHLYSHGLVTKAFFVKMMCTTLC